MIVNLDLSTPLHELILAEIDAQFSDLGEGHEHASFTDYDGTLFLFKKRTAPVLAHERSLIVDMCRRAITSTKKRPGAATLHTVVLFDCLDSEDQHWSPDFDLLAEILTVVAELFGEDLDSQVATLQYTLENAGVFSTNRLKEVAIAPIEEAFPTTEALTLMNETMDRHGLYFDLDVPEPFDDVDTLHDFLQDAPGGFGEAGAYGSF